MLSFSIKNIFFYANKTLILILEKKKLIKLYKIIFLYIYMKNAKRDTYIIFFNYINKYKFFKLI